MEIEAQDGLRGSHIAEIQRARLLSAMVEVCCERGAGAVAVSHVVARAGVSRRTFYELFEGCETCLVGAVESATEKLTARIGGAYDVRKPWRGRIRAALIELLRFCEEEQLLGRLLIVESQAAGRAVYELRAKALNTLVAAVDAGRAQPKRDTAPTPLAAEGIVGAVLFVLHRKLTEAEDGTDTPGPRALVDLVNPLMSLIVLPYLGAAAARAELGYPAVAPATVVRTSVNPLSELDIRLTYRTIRVLTAIATRPGCSNRDVGRAAGTPDPGQISKLLARLQRVGLIQNEQAQASKGSPNAWLLTPRGVNVQRTIAAHSGLPVS